MAVVVRNETTMGFTWQLILEIVRVRSQTVGNSGMLLQTGGNEGRGSPGLNST
jgi:hypothetical protein